MSLYLFCLCKGTENAKFSFDKNIYVNSKKEKILGIIKDSFFDNHIKEVCKKASQKLAALSRLASYLESEKRSLIFNSMIKSRFAYWHLVWMFCFRTSSNLISKTHEHSLTLFRMGDKKAPLPVFTL